MVDKAKYIERFKEIYKNKNGKVLDDVKALEYFEKLIALVEAVHVPISK